MGSDTVQEVPLVDLSKEDLKPGSGLWLSACSDVREALEKYGCIEVVYSKPSLEFHNRALSAFEDLFQLPLEVKMKNVNPKPGHGYLGKSPEFFPIYEGTGIENATKRDECLKFTNLMWPQGNDNFCETVHSYATIMEELHQLIIKMLLESYGIEKQDESNVNSPTYLMRMLKYKRSHGETNQGLKDHTDQSFLSILHLDHVKGLEIKTNDGDWVSFEPSSPSSFVVMVGDLCMAWSNGRMKSCFHRVIINSEEDRYTVGLFSFLKGIIKAPEELIDDEHPQKYRPFEHQGLIDFHLDFHRSNKDKLGETVEQQYGPNMLKAYCGL